MAQHLHCAVLLYHTLRQAEVRAIDVCSPCQYNPDGIILVIFLDFRNLPSEPDKTSYNCFYRLSDTHCDK